MNAFTKLGVEIYFAMAYFMKIFISKWKLVFWVCFQPKFESHLIAEVAKLTSEVGLKAKLSQRETDRELEANQR